MVKIPERSSGGMDRMIAIGSLRVSCVRISGQMQEEENGIRTRTEYGECGTTRQDLVSAECGRKEGFREQRARKDSCRIEIQERSAGTPKRRRRRH